MNMPGDLNFELVDESFVRVTAPLSGAIVGFILYGCCGVRSHKAFWYVDGHEYARFATLTEAAWALRDYWLGPVLRERVRTQLRQNDGLESVVRRMRKPRGERATFKISTRSERRHLYERLALHNAQAGGEYFKTN